MLRRIFPTIGLIFLASLARPVPAVAAPDVEAPPGYTVLARQPLGNGLTHLVLASRRQRVHVALMEAGAGYELRTVLSNDAIKEDGERLERTSSMCRRVRCLVAVNGDFFSEEGIPVGAVVSDGELVRSPSSAHHQLMIGADGRPATGTFAWRGRLVATDLSSVTIDAVNVERGADKTVLYTPAFGPSTETNRFGDELTLRIVQPEGPLRIGQTSLVEITGYRQGGGNAPISPNEVVLSGHGRGAQRLAALWESVRKEEAAAHALLRLDATPRVGESVGGTPILVRNGARWFADDGTAFARAANPRTMVGWNRSGSVMLVTVDGRQAGISRGMSLGEAAELMIALGATEAINLDGGGSTTFVVHGLVVNQPSDRVVRRGGREVTVRSPRLDEKVLAYVERPVADALAIVATGEAERLVDPFAGGSVSLPGPLDSPSPSAAPALGLPLAAAGGSVDADAVGATLALCALAAVWLRRRGSSPGA